MCLLPEFGWRGRLIGVISKGGSRHVSRSNYTIDPDSAGIKMPLDFEGHTTARVYSGEKKLHSEDPSAEQCFELYRR